MPSLAKNKSKSLKPKKVVLKNGHKNGHKNGIKVSAKVIGKTAILKKAGKVSKRTFFFGGGKADGTTEMKNLLGGKGANLAEMAQHRPAGAARLHDHDRGLHLLLRPRQAATRRR